MTGTSSTGLLFTNSLVVHVPTTQAQGFIPHCRAMILLLLSRQQRSSTRNIPPPPPPDQGRTLIHRTACHSPAAPLPSLSSHFHAHAWSPAGVIGHYEILRVSTYNYKERRVHSQLQVSFEFSRRPRCAALLRLPCKIPCPTA
jgi:hypothetical protein